jgi:RimJ/RimL family protein N-acetyltransferase
VREEVFVLETERLLLRPMTIDDVDALLPMFTDPVVMASFGGVLFDRDQMERWVRRNLAHQEVHGYGLFTVVLRESGAVVGDCGLEHMEVLGAPEVEVGYDLRSGYWGRGLATEAAIAVRDFAFGELGLERLISLIRAGNAASVRVAEKVGMSAERTFERGGVEYRMYSISRADRTG